MTEPCKAIDLFFRLIARPHYEQAKKAMEGLQSERSDLSSKDKQLAAKWPSVFTGCTLVSNRVTPAHRDKGAAHSEYSIVVSAGNHKGSHIEIRDANVRFHYPPGAVLAFSGSLFQHRVQDWGEGERLCGAFFMKEKVHERLVEGPLEQEWMTLDYFRLPVHEQ